MKPELYNLITGASRGIGKGIALECAKKELFVKKNIIKKLSIL